MGSHHKRNEGLKPIRRTAAKPKPEKKHIPVASTGPRTQAILAIQQAFLDNLQGQLNSVITSPDYDKKLQTIKGHFYRREYDQVFSKSELGIIYAAQYLPSRVLAYAELFREDFILDLLYPPPVPRRPSEKLSKIQPKRTKVVSIGAGVGSELCAVQLVSQIQKIGLTDDEDEDYLAVLEYGPHLDIVDSADYQQFLEGLDEAMLRYDNVHSISVSHTYHRRDILQWASTPEFANLLANSDLITFMFVFNELFASSKAQTMSLIGIVAKYLPVSSHVMLVESAGDLSQVKIESTRQVKLAPEEDETAEAAAAKDSLMVYKFWDFLPGFEKVRSEDRRWFRINKSLKYPLELENVGYFVRLYRKIG